MNKVFVFIFVFFLLVVSQTTAFAQEKRTAVTPGELIVKYKDAQSPDDIKENVRKREETKRIPVIGGALNAVENFNLRRQGEKLPEEKLKDVTEADKKAHVIKKEAMFPHAEENTISNLDDVLVIETKDNIPIKELEKIYESLSEVEYAQPNYIMEPTAIPNDSSYSQMWALSKIKADQAWDITKGSTNVIVAVIDSGIDYTHPDFTSQNIINGPDFANNDNDSFPSSSSHGTHVAGTIGAATNNGIGVSGLNWFVKLMAIKVFGGPESGKTETVTKAIRYAADNGAKVINMSLGADIYPYTCPQNDNLMQDAINYARAKGVVVVVAAGNDGYDVVNFTPAGCNGVIAVAATGPYDERAWYSNWGNLIDIAAPGGSDQPPSYTCTNSSCILSTWSSNFSPYLQYYSDEGTSMAAPHVSGVAALLLSVNPNLTPDQIESIIKNNADAISTDYNISGKRLNAFKALSAANAPIPTNTPVSSPTTTPTPLPPTPTPTPARFVAITQPNGGEILTKGQVYRIKWNSSSNIDQVSISYKACQSCSDSIISGISNVGYYDWSVSIHPSYTTTQFKISIIGYQTGVGSSTDESDNYFTVNPAPTNTPTPIPPTNTPIPPTPTPVEGDINGDNSVTITDFNIWKNEFSGVSTQKTSDLNKDGKVDLLDYSIWRNKFTP